MASNFTASAISSIQLKGQNYHLKNIAFHGTAAEWESNLTYVPKAGELIIYDADATNELRIKVGDGTSTVGELNYIVDNAALKRYVDTEIASLVNAAPETLDTLGEVAAAIAENEEVVEALNAAIGNKLDTEVYQEKILEIDTNLNNKVDKIAGKGLSSADFTAEEKAKLAGIEEGANNFVLPTATKARPGGVMVGNNIEVSDGVISINKQNVTDALGYTPAKSVAIDTTLTVSGAAADAKAVGDAFDALETVIALDQNADGNVELRSYIQAEEGEEGYTRLDTSLTVEGVAPDSKAVGDAINKKVNKSGDTMTGSLAIQTNDFPSLRMKNAEGKNILVLQTNTTSQKSYIYTYPVDESGYYEGYGLPIANDGLVESKFYNILTTKNKITLAQGGTGTDLSSYPAGAILIRGTEDGIGYHTILPMAKGGTGSSSIADAPANAIIRKVSDGNYLWYTATANGAFYATAENGLPRFGTLPIAQGGTGATTAAAARTNLGAVNIAGDTMTGTLIAPQVSIVNPTNSYPRIVLSCSDGTNNGKSQYASDTSTGRAYVAEWANGSNYYEVYSFPTPATDLTSNKSYTVLTNRNAVTIAQGGTGATTAAAARTALGAVSKTGDTITGTLHLSKTTDASAGTDSDVALIIGDRTSSHIVIDNNEIIAKSSGTTGGNLGLGQKVEGCFVQINGYLKFGSANYGTTLPAAGNSGRVFLLKV